MTVNDYCQLLELRESSLEIDEEERGGGIGDVCTTVTHCLVSATAVLVHGPTETPDAGS